MDVKSPVVTDSFRACGEIFIVQFMQAPPSILKTRKWPVYTDVQSLEFAQLVSSLVLAQQVLAMLPSLGFRMVKCVCALICLKYVVYFSILIFTGDYC